MVSANGSANASEAVWKSMPCLARFARLFPSSHSKAMTHYDKRKYICQYNITLALPRFSGALRRALATSVFNAALIVEGELGLLSRGFSAHISAQRLVRLLKSESVME